MALLVKIKTFQIKLTAILLIVIISIASFMYWLWQRQPSPQENRQLTSSTAQETDKNEAKEKSLKITPENGAVLKDNEITFQIESTPNEYVVIFSNLTQSVGKADEGGRFDVEIELEDSLNLINISTLNENLETTQSQSATYFIKQPAKTTTVFAGPVKSIFDEVITIATTGGEQTVRKKTSTDLILPTGEDGDIRVGDYLITLGTIENEKDFNAVSIEVIRKDKPQNSEKFIAGIILTEIKNNLFSLRNQRDAQIAEFTVDKNTIVSQSGQQADFEKVTKDQRAITLYHLEDNQNLADLVYLLP